MTKTIIALLLLAAVAGCASNVKKDPRWIEQNDSLPL